MYIKVYLNKVDEEMLKTLNQSEGAKCSDEEYAQKLFTTSLWLAYDTYYKKQEEEKDE